MARKQQKIYSRGNNTAHFWAPFLQMAQSQESPNTHRGTWAEREFLLPDKSFELPGFNWQTYQRTVPTPLSCLDRRSEVQHRVLMPGKDTAQHTWGFHMWLDVGQLPATFPTRPDKPYDSNIWRWLTNTNAHRMAPAETPVPPPSRLGHNSFLTFIYCMPIFLDTNREKQVIAKTEKILREGEKLKLRSQARVPPLDANGHILPPKNFKKYSYISAGGRFLLKGPQLLPNPLPNMFARCLPCPNPLPHYQKKSFRLVWQPSAPLNRDLVNRYVVLMKNRQVLPLYGVSGTQCANVYERRGGLKPDDI